MSFDPVSYLMGAKAGGGGGSEKETGTITYTKTLGSGTMEQWNCYKIHNIACVGARVYDINEPANGVFFNIPEGFRPREKTYFICYWVKSGGVLNTTNGCVDTNGDVSILFGSSQNLVQWGFALTYPV